MEIDKVNNPKTYNLAFAHQRNIDFKRSEPSRYN